MNQTRPDLFVSIGFLAVFLIATPLAGSTERTVIELGATMHYLSNTSDPGLGLAWVEPEFDDMAWLPGSFGVGFDELPGAADLLQTVVAPGTISIYSRAIFNVSDTAAVQSMVLGADYDDGYAAWINGVEVYRSPELPIGTLAWNTRPMTHESSNAAQPDYTPLIDISVVGMPALVTGENILAVAVWNAAASSSDLVLVPQLQLGEVLTVTRAAYLQLGTDSQITVRWRTNLPTDSLVRFGAAPNQLRRSVQQPEPTTEHVVPLMDLTAATRYYYSIGTATTELAGNDSGHYFETAPYLGTPDPVRIWVLGDSGTHNNVSRMVRDSYETVTGSQHTNLWLMLGDNAYPDGTDANYQEVMFDVFPAMLRKSVLWPTIGNHDKISSTSLTQTGPYFDMFTLPTAGEAGGVPSGTEAYYSFDYANIHFVVLDSQGLSRLPTGEMAIWLDADLGQNIQDWTIAFWHHPPYSKGSRDSDVERLQIEMRENLVPILEDHGVDLVLCGHSHSYERSYLIDGHYGLSSTFDMSMLIDAGNGRESEDGAYVKTQLGSVPGSGAVYTVAGSSGQISGGALDHPVMAYSFNVKGSVILDIESNRMDLSFLDTNQEVIDHFTMTKGFSGLIPIADFSASPVTGSAPLEVQFTDRSTHVPTAWEWDFDDDGSVDTTLRHPLVTIAEPGLVSVRMTASNASGSDAILKDDLICVVSAVPAQVDHLVFLSTAIEMSWSSTAIGSTYDVIKGDLGQLRAQAGGFADSIIECLSNGTGNTSAVDAAMPPADSGFYYLVRPVDCALQDGSFDSDGDAQVAPRDPQLSGVCGLGVATIKPQLPQKSQTNPQATDTSTAR